MTDTAPHHSNDVSIRYCTEGCIVLQFGVTMVHLEEEMFHQFAHLTMAASIQAKQKRQFRQHKKLRQTANECACESVSARHGYEA